MNSEEITKLLFADKFTKDIFCGCYAKDQILNQHYKKYPRAYIVNTHDHYKPGEHWVAMHFENSYTGSYFDSYGIAPIQREFSLFMSRNTAKWNYNCTMIQDFSSTNCGKFCVYFIKQRSRAVSLYDLVNVFSDNLQLNDEIIENFVHV